MCHNQSFHFEIRNSNRVVVVMFDVSVNDRVRNIRLVFDDGTEEGNNKTTPTLLEMTRRRVRNKNKWRRANRNDSSSLSWQPLWFARSVDCHLLLDQEKIIRVGGLSPSFFSLDNLVFSIASINFSLLGWFFCLFVFIFVVHSFLVDESLLIVTVSLPGGHVPIHLAAWIRGKRENKEETEKDI